MLPCAGLSLPVLNPRFADKPSKWIRKRYAVSEVLASNSRYDGDSRQEGCEANSRGAMAITAWRLRGNR
jgi:hypothetical protein